MLDGTATGLVTGRDLTMELDAKRKVRGLLLGCPTNNVILPEICSPHLAGL